MPHTFRNAFAHMRADSLAAVAVGGAAGTSARYGLGLAIPAEPGGWPVATFTINIAGAFLLGALLATLTRVSLDARWRQRARLFLGTGVLGSFTTYSALALETDRLIGAGHTALGFGYLVASAAGGVAAAAGGGALVGFARPRETTRGPA
ncbi:Camphor resistance CrcB protein [Segniliparus rotundus DSM 44985]|uniref:Fluoride-specific ion channel FluC n=1 Tax=Segniliparus rotundus (strain ATCC BAA-972 / CDC 1076 / CIP 108378 / DSM 44985 / JCM 13578) TaxID=640132 RepID=D6ZE48_SEGRD|nr:CrcB family protein [Segniliparus rotundus]ADG97328.1 Camphor resistance CrcB protein [Segniliparus rotundus DSM 44985]